MIVLMLMIISKGAQRRACHRAKEYSCVVSSVCVESRCCLGSKFCRDPVLLGVKVLFCRVPLATGPGITGRDLPSVLQLSQRCGLSPISARTRLITGPVNPRSEMRLVTHLCQARLITGPVNPKSETRSLTGLCQDAANHRSCKPKVGDAVSHWSLPGRG